MNDCDDLIGISDFETSFFENFQQFLEKDTFASSYKLIFLKSLLYLGGIKNANIDIAWGRDWYRIYDKKLIVKLEFLAVPFLKFYWDMFFKYRLKQSSTKNQYYTCKDCNLRQTQKGFIKNISMCTNCNSFNLKHNDDVLVHKLFVDSEGVAIMPPKKIQKVATNLDLLKRFIYEQRRGSTKISGFSEVLHALNKKGFFHEIPNFNSRSHLPRTVLDNGLEFDIKIIDVLRKFRIPIENALNYKLTWYLESINNSPRISQKISLDPKRPKLKTLEEKQMWEYNPCGKDRCFYCGEKCQKSFHIDHVIPFDYVLDTKLFNSVPACHPCNLSKSNKLPDYEIHFKRVMERNRKMDLDYYEEKMFEKIYDECLREYNGDRDFFVNRGI
tara:strand:+ start:708 stop:1862 length:1155 start_codon:yes stop_codon:yes gene_type:complete